MEKFLYLIFSGRTGGKMPNLEYIYPLYKVKNCVTIYQSFKKCCHLVSYTKLPKFYLLELKLIVRQLSHWDQCRFRKTGFDKVSKSSRDFQLWPSLHHLYQKIPQESKKLHSPPTRVRCFQKKVIRPSYSVTRTNSFSFLEMYLQSCYTGVTPVWEKCFYDGKIFV